MASGDVYLTGFCSSSDGPFWSDNRTVNNVENVDLTLCFQYTVLEWIPFCWMLLVCGSHVLLLRKAPTRHKVTAFGKFHRLKQVAAALLCLTAVCCFVDFLLTDASIAANVGACMAVLTYLVVMLIMHYEYRKAINSSGPIFLFWLVNLVCVTLQFQSVLRGSQPNNVQMTMVIIGFVFTVALFFMHCFADNTCVQELDSEQIPFLHAEEYTVAEEDKNYSDYFRKYRPSPELHASFLTRLTYLWFFELVLYARKHTLALKDFWRLLYPLRCRNLTKKMGKFWERQVASAWHVNNRYGQNSTESSNLLELLDSDADQSSRPVAPSFIKAFFHMFLPQFLFSACWRLLFDALTLIQPVLLNLIINSFTDPVKWHGWLIGVAMFVVAVVRSFVLTYHWRIEWLYTIRVQSAIGGLVYKKALKLSTNGRKNYSAGEVVNLFSVDVEHVAYASFWSHYVYSGPLNLAVVFFLLWQQLGPASLTGLLLILLFLPTNVYLSRRAAKLQDAQMSIKDERIKHVTEMLNGVKILKLYGWSTWFAKKITEIRKRETGALKTMLNTFAWLYSIFDCAPTVITVCTFLVYVLVSPDNNLDPAKAFVSIQLISILNDPMSSFPFVIATLTQCAVSLKRLNKFMQSEEINVNTVQKARFSENAVSISNGSFTADKQSPSNILNNVTLSLPKSALVAVVGRVGDGKTSLLNAILGELHCTSGSIAVDGKIAYVPQQAWIINATIRENILFGQPYSLRKYQQVLDACALQPDLKILPHGDQTEIGERGVTLSGGQKQRVSLARAVYRSDCSIYLLDDPLSAVDAHVGRHLFEHVFGPVGMLSDKCRILVTNSLFALPSADHVLLMDGGRIAESGSYAQLMEKSGAFFQLISEYQKQAAESGDDQSAAEGSKNDDNTVAKIAVQEADGNGNGNNHNGPTKAKSLSLKRKPPVKNEAAIHDSALDNSDGKLVEDEQIEENAVRTENYATYFKSMGLKVSSLIAIGSLGMLGGMVALNLWLAAWSEDDSSENVAIMRVAVYGALGLIELAFILLRYFAMAVGVTEASRTLHNTLLDKVIRAPMAFFDVTPVGRITNRFARDMDAVDTRMSDVLPYLVYNLVVLVSIIITLIVSAPILIVAIVPLAVAYAIVYSLYVRTQRQIKRIESSLRAPVLAHLHTTLLGVSSIRAYEKQESFTLDFEKLVDEAQMAFYALLMAYRWLFTLLEALNDLLVLITALFAVGMQGAISTGLASIIVTYPLQLTYCGNYVLRGIADVDSVMVGVERIRQYNQLESEAALEVPESDDSLPDGWPWKGRIEFRKYSVRYRAGLDLVLQDVNAVIEPGERIGIVGRTGAGKSSLSLALFRIVEPASGTIFIDNVDIRNLGLQKLRTRLTIIPQDPVLFSGSLRMNLDPTSAFTDDAIWTALNDAHLKEFVSNLPQTLNHECTEGGENFSVGQRQLVCLARALLRKTKVLVLDEATASVDVETDELIQKTIRLKFDNCTVLTIAHRLNTIMDYDRVMVLDAGQIREFASPATLMQDSESIFYSLVRNANSIL